MAGFVGLKQFTLFKSGQNQKASLFDCWRSCLKAKTYEQSTTLAAVRARHPFPWTEQRFGGLVRMVDANGQEVILFELTALASIFTRSIVAQEQQKAKNEQPA